jgi:hypothetical protein
VCLLQRWKKRYRTFLIVGSAILVFVILMSVLNWGGGREGKNPRPPEEDLLALAVLSAVPIWLITLAAVKLSRRNASQAYVDKLAMKLARGELLEETGNDTLFREDKI